MQSVNKILQVLFASIILLITIYGATAEDAYHSVVDGGSMNGLVRPTFGFSYAHIPPPGSDPSGGKESFERYYDVILKVRQRTYQAEEIVEADLLIDLFGTEPKQDGILHYTLVTPEGVELSRNAEIFKEGDHNKFLTYPLPENAMTGQWTFRVNWLVEGLEVHVAEDVFNVGETQPFLPSLPVVASVIFGVLFLFTTRKRKVVDLAKPD